MQDLGTKCVVAKFVLWFLLPEQKEHRAEVANDLIQTPTNEPDFLKKFDASWVNGYDLEMKAQWSQWKSPGSLCSKEVWQSHSKIKTMLTVFFDWKGFVHHEYAPPGSFIKTTCPTHALHLVLSFSETSSCPGYSAPLQPRFVAL